MIKVAVKIKVNSTIISKALDKVKANAELQVRKSYPKLRQVIANLVVKYVRDTKTYISFNGGGGVGEDLRAEFGLNDELATLAMRRLLEIVRQHAVSFTPPIATPFKTVQRSLVNFRIKILDYNDYYDPIIADKLFSYVSTAGKEGHETEFDIEWMKWVLNANRGMGIIQESVGSSIKSYGILYNLNARQKGFSRSGRALMVKPSAKTHPDRFPYQMPEAARPRSGRRNFLDEVSHNPELRQEIANVVKSILIEKFEHTPTVNVT